MLKRKFMAALLGVSFLSACSGSYRNTYLIGSATKEFTTQAYDVYSEEFNKKLQECDPENNSEVTTKTLFDECMGDAFKKDTHDKIVTAIDVFYEASKSLTAVLELQDASSKEDRQKAIDEILASAIALLEMLPNGEKMARDLKKIAGK